MIDPITASVLCAVADVYVATGRTIPAWVADALLCAARDPLMPAIEARRVAAVLREVNGQESMTA